LAPVIIALLFITLILFAAINLSMRKIKKLEPANAIRYGYVRKDKKIKRSTMLSNTVFDLALREIKLHPLKSVIKSMIICIFALLMFSVSLVNSVMGKGLFTACTTIGMPNCEIFLQSNNMDLADKGEEIVSKIKKVDGVKEVIPVIMSTNVFAVKGEEKISMLVDALDSFENANLELLEGRNPENDFEAAVGSIALQQLGKKIGDMITLNIDGSESTYLITGSFQIISNDGKAARITKGAYLKANPNKDYNWYAVMAKDGTDLKNLKQSIQRVVGGQITATIMSEFIGSMIGSIETGFNMLCMILICIIALICGASLFNIIQLHMAENRKIYGIFKGIGMSGSTINRIQYLKEFFIATLGIATGLILTVALASSILNAIFSSTRLTQISYTFSVTDILLRAGIIYLVVIASVFPALWKNGKTNLRELIME
jgi:putative ABC transport system permease protein